MSGNTEELGIRLNAQGVPETTAGINLAGKAVDDLGKKLDGAGKPLANAEAGIGRTGNTAKQTAAAFRLLPAQITDVVTSLASGQPAWLVAIQQGGQIKDSFGGIVPAAKALVGAINPMSFALGGAALATGALILAHEKGSREAQSYATALILTGNAAGTNANQLGDMARAISASVGTQGKAAEALTAIAATGEVARVNLQGFADLGVQMERTLGQPLTDTAAKFQELGRAPLEASLKLNRGVNYLTASVYEQIRALQAQGRMAEAGEVAQKAYADAMAGRTNKVAENLGTLQRATKATGDFFKEMWDKVLDIGRADTLEQKIAKVRAEIEMANKPNDPLASNNWAKGRKAANQALLDDLLKQQQDANKKAEDEAANTAQNKEELRQREQAMVSANVAITVAQAQAAATAQESIANKQLAQAEAAATRRETIVRQGQATLEDLRSRDFVSSSDYYGRSAALERQALASQVTLVDAQIAAEQRLLSARRAVVEAQIAGEQQNKPTSEADALQQRARLAGLAADRARTEAEGEVRIIGLKSQRTQITAQQSAADVAAERAFAREQDASMAQFAAGVAQRRQALTQFDDAQRDSNNRQAADLIADPYKRATEMARLDVVDLNRMYEEQLSALKARLPLLQIFQPEEAAAVQQQIIDAEQRKADGIVLINKRLGEDLKPEWQRMLEGWSDTTRLMRESYDQFQTGWLQAGENAWVQFTKTGKLNIGSLRDFALGQFGQMTFRSLIAPQFAKLGDGVASLFGITGGAVGDAAKTAGMAAETTARTVNNVAVTTNTTALGILASAAGSASAALAAVAASGSGSAAAGFLGFLGSAISGGATGGEAIGGFNGSAGDAFIPGNVGHTGMIAGIGEGRSASYASSTWAGAGRLHTGGLAGDEVPAILQRGEGVFTKGQMKALAPVGQMAGGGGNTITLSPTIYIDSRTDKAEVAQMVQQGMRAAKAELLEAMDRGTT